MARGRGAFKSEKRKKELIRQKKQQEKRQKRFHKDATTGEMVETTEETPDPSEAAVTPEAEEAAPAGEKEGSQEQGTE